MRTLTIISHTEHYRKADGTIVGLGSTVTEINALLTVFDYIIHVGMLHDIAAPPSAMPYVSDRIQFMKLPALGGSSLKAKMALVLHAPKIIATVQKALKQSDYFQFRAPTGIGVFVIPYLVLFTSKKGWFKYAGNWKQPNPPLAYRFQKWLLEHQSRWVTINGFWEGQPQHCLSFENPCLTVQDIEEGQAVIQQKELQYPIDFCFVGRLEAAKGLDLLLETFGQLDSVVRQKMGTLHVVGAGSKQADYELLASHLQLSVIFYGYVSRQEVHAIYKQCHGIILPSASEGFPKVIAEAMNFGCMPIVSNVSSISHYIHPHINGFLIDTLDVDALSACIIQFTALKPNDYKRLQANAFKDIGRFSYSSYNQRLLKSIL